MMCLLLALMFLSGAASAHECPAVPECRAPNKVHRLGSHGLINPLLDVEFEFSELRPFKHKVQQLVQMNENSAEVDHVSVYFRDLNNGPLFGINEKESFAPASLLKLPLMFAVLGRAEKDPSFLWKQILYQPQTEMLPSIATTTLRTGEYYTIDQLMRAMIVDSDNTAAFLLRAMLAPGDLEEIYADLGLMIANVRTPEDYMTVREYGTFFRILYNASYLSKANSNKALETLAASTFTQGLQAGVPPGMTVAHKFGERYNLKDKHRQLHDCGIVYYAPRPYILCVMTRGQDFMKMAETIRDISRMVYTEVATQEAPSP